MMSESLVLEHEGRSYEMTEGLALSVVTTAA